MSTTKVSVSFCTRLIPLLNSVAGGSPPVRPGVRRKNKDESWTFGQKSTRDIMVKKTSKLEEQQLK